MKEVTTPMRGQAGWRVPVARRVAGLALALMFGALVTSAQAQFTLKTLSGGPNEADPTTFPGYVDGVMQQDGRGPKFNGPMGLAIGGNGTFLLVADKTNNAVRKVSIANNTTTTVTQDGITNPVAVLLDSANNMYVLNQGVGAAAGRVIMFDQFGNLVKTNISGLASPTAMAMDGSTNLYVCVSTGAVFRVSNTATTTVGIVSGGGVALRGIAVRDDGKIAVSDAGNHVILLIDPTLSATPAGNNVTLLAGVSGVSGTNFGTLGFAKFNQPHGIAKAGGGLLVVADRHNHRVSVVDSAGTVTNMYGISSNAWIFPPAGLENEIFPGWADVPPANNRGEAREPVAVAVSASGSIFASEVYYHLVRQCSGTGITGPSDSSGGGGGGSTNGVVVPAPTINPDRGFFPMGVTITVNSSVPDVFYTTDGTDPTTNSTRVVIDGNVGSIQWNNPTNDLTGLRVRAFISTNASAVVSGQPISVNTVGAPPTLNTNFYAGIGSTVVVPIVAGLRPGTTIKSLQFNVDVVATNGSPAITGALQLLPIGTNDFVQFAVPSSDGAPVTLSTSAYTDTDEFANPRKGLGAFTTGSSTFELNNFGAVALLVVPIPGTATEGQIYHVRLRNVSGTADGGQTEVTLTNSTVAVIEIRNLSYLVGDTSPGRWYSAGDFGNTGTTNLNNSDVNNAFFASLGVRTPFTFSDAFNAMDTFPDDQPGFVGGNNLITFADWQRILQRALRLPGQSTNNWYRAWSPGGTRTNTAGPVSLSRTVQSEPAPGNVWYREALLGGKQVENANPGQTVNLPVYVKLASGATLAGMQFRAVITGSEGAPALTAQATFAKSASIPNPDFILNQAKNDILRGWSLVANTLNLTASSNLIGWVQFTIPATAQAGQCYSVQFLYPGGQPNYDTEYTFETKSAGVWVQSTSPEAVDGLSDEWKTYFFGGVGVPDSGAADDPDGDGVSNWREYQAGTDPTDANSKLELSISGTGVSVTLTWLSAPGKTYIVESATTLSPGDWATVQTVSGNGQVKQVTQTHGEGETRFYRVRLQP